LLFTMFFNYLFTFSIVTAGAIYFSGPNATTINNTLFYNNSGKNYLNSESVKLILNFFSCLCYLGDYIGAVLFANTVPSSSPIIIENSQFIESNGLRGALRINRRNGTVDIISCNFTENIANDNLEGGGALYLQQVTQSRIIDSFFSRNKAGNSGGAIWAINSSLNIQSSEFDSNYASSMDYCFFFFFLT